MGRGFDPDGDEEKGYVAEERKVALSSGGDLRGC